jgi:ABC-type transport system substrate-binding protein
MNRRMILPVLLIISIIAIPYIATPVEAKNPGPFFSVSILSPNSNPARNQWATLMVEQLPKIGIGIDVFDHTGWAQISPRTWGHPGPYPVPSYAEGGYDLFFIGNGWGLDFDPTGVFTSDGITPAGDNFYQYENPEFDWAVGNYTQSFVYADRIQYAEEIQYWLYEDQPSIAIIYDTSLFAHKPGLTGWDPLLWASSQQPMEDWAISGETELHFAVPADFEDFHVWTQESTYDAQWIHQIWNGLVERNLVDYTYSGRALQTFSSTDGITYTCQLRPDLYWADGVPVTVEDVIYNYQLAVTASLGHTLYSFNTLYWDNSSVIKIDDDDFTIEFLQPYVFQESNLANPLIPKHIWESITPADHGEQAVTWARDDPSKLIGFGPYKFGAWDDTNGVIRLDANDYFDDYWGSAPEFDTIYFEFYSNKEGAVSALAGGDIDIVDAEFYVDFGDIQGLPGVDYTTVDAPGNQELAVNQKHPYLGTGELCPISDPESGKHIRKAISHMVPRQVIVDEILDGLGYPGVTHWPKVSIGFDETLEAYEYSIELALEEMALAGFDVTITTAVSGIGLIVFMSIIALAGASQVFFLKKRK